MLLFLINCSVKRSSLNLTILKWKKNLSLPLKVETDQFVFCLVLPECLSVKICFISSLDSEANHDSSDAKSPFPLFFSISTPHLRTLAQEKRRKLSLFWDRWAESLFVAVIVPKYNILPRPNNGHLHEKNSGEAICSHHQPECALSGF